MMSENNILIGIYFLICIISAIVVGLIICADLAWGFNKAIELLGG